MSQTDMAVEGKARAGRSPKGALLDSRNLVYTYLPDGHLSATPPSDHIIGMCAKSTQREAEGKYAVGAHEVQKW